MDGISFFDIVLIILTLFLGLKGLMRGFIKEFFGLVGIIGGVFFASRISHDIGYFINGIVPIENESTKSLIGFVLAFIAIWLVAYLVGMIVSKISSMSGLGIFDRILGFIFGAAKIFFIFAIIIYALSKIEAVKTKLDENLASSMMYPILQEVGDAIIKLDAQGISQKIEENIEQGVESVKDGVTQDIIDESKEKINEQIENIENSMGEN